MRSCLTIAVLALTSFAGRLTLALISKQYEIMQAIKASIEADAEIVAVQPTWRLQKRPWHRYFKWEPGAYIVPVRSALPPFENRVRQYDFRVLVVAVYPSDQSLTEAMAQRLAVHERIDTFFSYTPMALLPAPMQALLLKYSGTNNQYSLEKTTVEPGEQFAEGAFQAGLDAIASLVTVTVTGPKQDYSTLGA